MVSTPENSHIPDSPEPIYESLHDREKARMRAVHLAREKADQATNDVDRDFYLRLAAEMSDITSELRDLFPTIFPEAQPDDPDGRP